MLNARIVDSEVTVLAAARGVDGSKVGLDKVGLDIVESTVHHFGGQSLAVADALAAGDPIRPVVLGRFMTKYGWNLVDPRNSPFSTAGHKTVFDINCLPDRCVIQTSSGIAALADGKLIATENSAFECQHFQLCGYWVPGGSSETSLDYWVRRMTQLVSERA